MLTSGGADQRKADTGTLVTAGRHGASSALCCSACSERALTSSMGRAGVTWMRLQDCGSAISDTAEQKSQKPRVRTCRYWRRTPPSATTPTPRPSSWRTTRRVVTNRRRLDLVHKRRLGLRGHCCQARSPVLDRNRTASTMSDRRTRRIPIVVIGLSAVPRARLSRRTHGQHGSQRHLARPDGFR